MLVASGTLLVLLTWAIGVTVVVSLGLLASAVVGDGQKRSQILRGALWWGLLGLALLAYAANLVAPLQSPESGAFLLAGLLLLGAPGWWLWWRGMPDTGGTRWWMVFAASLVAVTLAVAALGPVTNYDSGLYHLQAIRYAAEYATVPGLANVYFPLGYSNAEFPLAALMGLGPWGFEGFRLINGLVLVLALIDLVIRWRKPRRGAGFYVLLTGITVVVITMVPLADYWVTSPTQDSTVFVVTVVATAYLAEAVSRDRWVHPAGVTTALMILLVLLRPTMVVFALGCLVVLVTIWWRRRLSRERNRTKMLLVSGVLAGGVAALLATARDFLLSGWLQYPLSLVAFDVPWRAADPTDVRKATLGAARDPDDLWAAAESWGWIPSWFARLPSQWETYAFALLALAAAGLLVFASRFATMRWRALALVMLPSLAATAFWWLFSPPSFRFAWGPVFTLATICVGWAFWRLRMSRGAHWPLVAERTSIGILLAVVAITLLIRTDYATMNVEREWHMGLSVPYVVAPVKQGIVDAFVNDSGLEVRAPVEGDQCWLAFPTCSPQLLESLRLRGEGIGSGYLP